MPSVRLYMTYNKIFFHGMIIVIVILVAITSKRKDQNMKMICESTISIANAYSSSECSKDIIKQARLRAIKDEQQAR